MSPTEGVAGYVEEGPAEQVGVGSGVLRVVVPVLGALLSGGVGAERTRLDE